jgi:hypothetical protein
MLKTGCSLWEPFRVQTISTLAMSTPLVHPLILLIAGRGPMVSWYRIDYSKTVLNSASVGGRLSLRWLSAAWCLTKFGSCNETNFSGHVGGSQRTAWLREQGGEGMSGDHRAQYSPLRACACRTFYQGIALLWVVLSASADGWPYVISAKTELNCGIIFPRAYKHYVVNIPNLIMSSLFFCIWWKLS